MGGGYLLAALKCREKLGVEVNPAARNEAAAQGVKVVSTTDEVPGAWADVVVSNSALEHTEQPLLELRKLLPKMKPGGKLVFGIPHESLSWAYGPGDQNQHLYTWSPMSAGNLFSAAGFTVERVYTIKSMWPPKYRMIHGLFGAKLFGVICKAYRLLRVLLSPVKRIGADAQIVVIARQPISRECSPASAD